MFELLADGATLGSIAKRFEREGLSTPNGGKHWYVPSLKRMVENDVYKGIWWYGQNRVKLTPMGDKKRTWQKIDRDEWVAIPVPYSGIPHEVIDAAREDVGNSYRPRKASRFDYELRGMVRCACCGTLMNGYSVKGWLLSSSYVPDAGEPGHQEMMEDARRLFEEHQADGTVVLKYDTQVFFGPLSGG